VAKSSPLDRLVRENRDLQDETRKLREEVRRLKGLMTPETKDFVAAVEREAAYQRDHWGAKHDEEKSDADWYWTLGWLAGKAVNDPHDQDDTRTPLERKLHRIVTAAALACNWHAAVKKRGT